MAYDPTNGAASYGYVGGPFGSQVPQIPMPNPMANLSAAIPGLTNLNTQASAVLGSELTGALSPDTQRAIKDASATMAVYNGMPGTSNTLGTLSGNKTARDIGLTSQQLQTQGLADYSRFVPTVSQTQTVNPALQAEVNLQNAVSSASPNPGMAQSYAQNLFNQYINQLNRNTKPKTQAESMGLANTGTYWTPPGSNKFLSGYPL